MNSQLKYFLLILPIALVLCASHAQAQHLHAVFVVACDDASIGKSVWVDGQNMINWIQTGLSANRYTIHVVEGEAASPKNVISKIKNLPIKREDAVLFYYSGHGAFDNQTGTHYFQFSNSSNVLQRSTVKNAIRSLAPRLTVMISDCCASILPLRRDDFNPESANASGGQGVTPIVSQLFFNTRGVVDITSSRPGQYSVGYPDGGVLTNAFLSVVQDYRYETPKWDEVFARTRWRASSAFEHKNADKRLRNKGLSNKQFTQTAWSFEPMYDGDPNIGRLGVFIDQNDSGKISFVQPGSAARSIGLAVGDRITSINGVGNLTTDQIVDRVNNSSQNLTLTVVCIRTKNHYRMTAKLPF